MRHSDDVREMSRRDRYRAAVVGPAAQNGSEMSHAIIVTVNAGTERLHPHQQAEQAFAWVRDALREYAEKHEDLAPDVVIEEPTSGLSEEM